MQHLYGGAILFVDLNEGKVSIEPTTSYTDAFLGGRGINIKLLYDRVPPEVAPLDPACSLIFGVGPLCGTPIPAPRTEVTTKSPETGLLGSSNFGGFFGPELKFAGYDHIVVTGRAEKPVYIWINNEHVEIRDASHLWGKDTFETQEIIRSGVDPDAKVACIGQAGENLVHFATIQHELKHGAGRTGTGCVMGSKNLKAIAVRGTKGISLANPEQYLSIAGELQYKLTNNPAVRLSHKHGYSRLTGAFSNASKNPGDKTEIYSDGLYLKYRNKIKRTGCFGCPMQCIDQYPVEAKGGGGISCGLYYESRSLLKNDDMNQGLECIFGGLRYGVDSVSTFGIIRWLMELYENGIITAKDTDDIPMEWGRAKAIKSMLWKIVHREGIGDVLADGILPAAKRIGRDSIDYAYQVKGLITHHLYDVFSSGVALSVTMGRGDPMKSSTSACDGILELLPLIFDAKTTAEYAQVIQEKVREIAHTEKALSRNEYEGKPELVAFCEDEITICDCLSVCKAMGVGWFGIRPFTDEYRAALLSAGTGVEMGVDVLFEVAKRVKNLERAYSIREGMTREFESLPKRCLDYSGEGGYYRHSVMESSKFEKLKDKYYHLRGWDIDTGIPTRDTLQGQGLGYVADDLESRGKLPGNNT